MIAVAADRNGFVDELEAAFFMLDKQDERALRDETGW
jgi:hypothetical protein